MHTKLDLLTYAYLSLRGLFYNRCSKCRRLIAKRNVVLIHIG